ncbi:MAG TPA: YbhB/YbcL family Raf kinase inhibitor-like protein [Gemmatimonadales bacterium]
MESRTDAEPCAGDILAARLEVTINAEEPMFRRIATPIAAFTLLAGGITPAQAQNPGAFVVTSTDVHTRDPIGSAQVFSGMGCTGSNISPALQWHGAPAKTRSFAVTVYDPDAPTGSGWWHWVVYNIPATAKGLPTGAGDPAKHLLPAGASQGNTDFGTAGYGGPCPPAGDKPHHYIFTVYALDVPSLEIPAGSTAAFVGFNLHGHTIAKASMTAMFGR